MDLSLGIPGHCPGFIPRLCLVTLTVNLSPFEPLYICSYLSTDTAPQYPQAPAQYVVSHAEFHCCDAPIQPGLPVQSSFWTSSLTAWVLGHHSKKCRLTSIESILKIKLYSTVKSIEFQKWEKKKIPINVITKVHNINYKGLEADSSPVWSLFFQWERVSAVRAHRRPPSGTS